MADSTTILDLIAASQAAKEVTANAVFDAASPATLFGRRATTTSALTWGYYGGKYRKVDGTISVISNGTVSLTASATNFILETDGVVSKVTAAPTGWPAPLAGGAKALYAVVCDGSGPTSYTDYRTTGIGSGSAGSVTSVNITAPAAGITASGGPVTSSGAITLALANDLAAVEGLSGTGVAVRTGTDTWALRTLDTDTTLAANSNTAIATQAAVKSYVDAAVQGLSWKQAVRVATTASGTLSTAYANGSAVDGVTLATGDRILIKDQSTGSENGIYLVAASGAPSRALDADAGSELVNAAVFVSEGTTNADTQWVCTNNATITLGSTSIAFAQLGGSATPAGSAGGDLAGTYPNPAVANNAVTYAKMQDVSATSRVLGRKTAGAGDPEECTLSDVLDFIGSAAQGDILYRGASSWARLGAGTSGQYLQTQGAGANPLWATSSSGTPGGSTTQVQFNDGGAFGGDADMTWDKTNNILVIGSTTTAGVVKGADGTGANPGAAITIKGGASGTTAGGTNKGGSVNILGGTPGNGDGGDVNITAANAVTLASGSEIGGSVNITAGDATVGGQAGEITLTGGAQGSGNLGRVMLKGGLGGNFTTQAIAYVGVATTTGTSSGAGITLVAGNGKAAGEGGGLVNIQSGSGGTSNQAGGNITISAGAGGSGSSGALGGSVTITGGAGTTTTTGAAGSAVNMVGGAAGGTGSNNGGNVLLKGGAATGTGAKGNVGVDNGAAVATSATGGFLVIPTCAGAPTGTPANIPTGSIALVYDTTNNKLYVYNGAWKGVTLA